MMLLPCPSCGNRNVSEFRYVGEAKSRPEPDRATPGQWRRYLYFHQNPLGWTRETWYHTTGCRRYFALERHTGSNQVRRVGPGGRP
jgi:heterotetrameric sarcosine oxidase delta subunit